MIDLTAPHRAATRGDAPALADLVNFAGEGLPLYLWTAMATAGASAREVGLERARREEGGFSYRHAVVREEGGRVAAALIGYPLPDEPAAIDYDETPPMFVPLEELENLAPKTWYVNVLAAYPEHRGKGYGSDLLDIAEQLAAATGCRGMSLIVSDANTGARRLYARHGYTERATRTMVKENWQNRGTTWLLLLKDL